MRCWWFYRWSFGNKTKKNGHWVRGVDLKMHEFKKSDADEFIIADLRNLGDVDIIIDNTIDWVFQLAADMGGSTYINTGENDSDVMHNSCMINLNVLKTCTEKKVKKIFYSSTACVYPEYNQLDPNNPHCSEDSVYPAQPDTEYGWEKLFSERLYFAFANDYGIDIRIARYHNIYGPYGTWDGGKEKAPAALCRKVAKAVDNTSIDVYGDGSQTRSFLYIDECIEGTVRLMESDFTGPVNIGSEEMISINDFAEMIIMISKKNLKINNIVDFNGVGVRGRNSDNKLIKDKLNWSPEFQLIDGIKITYDWILEQV